MPSILQPSSPDPNVRMLERISRLETEVTELRRHKGFYTNNATFAAGWRAYQGGTAEWGTNIEATRTSDGLVILEGLVDKGTNGLNAHNTIANLPPGFRPRRYAMFTQIMWKHYPPNTGTDGMIARRVDINPGGDVIMYFDDHPNPENYNCLWLSLQGIMFRPV